MICEESPQGPQSYLKGRIHFKEIVDVAEERRCSVPNLDLSLALSGKEEGEKDSQK